MFAETFDCPLIISVSLLARPRAYSICEESAKCLMMSSKDIESMLARVDYVALCMN